MSAETSLPIANFAAWLAHGERGPSSEAIVEHLTGHGVGGRAFAAHFGRGDHPYDPGDFRRCELLLREVPIARLVFGRMRDVSAQWSALVDAWDEIVALMESEVPDVFTQTVTGGRAPLAYARIRQCLEIPA